MCKILYSEFSIILEAFWQGSERLEAWQQCCDESYQKVRNFIRALVALTALVWCPLNTSFCPRTPIRPPLDHSQTGRVFPVS